MHQRKESEAQVEGARRVHLCATLETKSQLIKLLMHAFSSGSGSAEYTNGAYDYMTVLRDGLLICCT